MKAQRLSSQSVGEHTKYTKEDKRENSVAGCYFHQRPWTAFVMQLCIWLEDCGCCTCTPWLASFPQPSKPSCGISDSIIHPRRVYFCLIGLHRKTEKSACIILESEVPQAKAQLSAFPLPFRLVVAFISEPVRSKSEWSGPLVFPFGSLAPVRHSCCLVSFYPHGLSVNLKWTHTHTNSSTGIIHSHSFTLTVISWLLWWQVSFEWLIQLMECKGKKIKRVIVSCMDLSQL